MFFNYPDEYSVPVNYSDNLIEKNNEREKSLLREIDPFSEKIEPKEDDLEKSNSKRRESIFEEADEEYINDEVKVNI